MEKIKFVFNDGTVSEVEVPDELYLQYSLLEHRESLIERKETRRHQSLDKSLELGFDIAVSKINIEDKAENNELIERLHKAILKLKPQQQKLIRRIYFYDEKMSDIAREEGVDASSVRHRMQRALKRLKKILE